MRTTREGKAASRHHVFRPNMPIIKKQAILKSSVDKQGLNKPIFEAITTDENFLITSTDSHRLIIMHENDVPIKIHKGRQLPRVDLPPSHEEADVVIAKHAIISAKEQN